MLRIAVLVHLLSLINFFQKQWGLTKNNLSPFSRQDILNYVGCHVKHVVFSDFNQNWNMLTDFCECHKYDLMKFLADGWTDARLIVVLCSYFVYAYLPEPGARKQ
jgi:hypothetical protein